MSLRATQQQPHASLIAPSLPLPPSLSLPPPSPSLGTTASVCAQAVFDLWMTVILPLAITREIV